MSTAPENATGASARRHRWRIDLLVIASVYLPQLLPFVVGPLTECDHCISSYLKLFPVLPGMLPSYMMLGSDSFAMQGVVTAVALLMLRGIAALGRVGTWVALVVGVLGSSANALNVAFLLRA